MSSAKETIALSLGAVVNEEGVPTLFYALRELSKIQLPPLVAFHVAVNKNAIAGSPQAQSYEEIRSKIMNAYCKKDEEGRPVIEKGKLFIEDDNVEKVREEMNHLLNQGISLELHRINLSDLSEATGLTGAIMQGLMPILNY